MLESIRIKGFRKYTDFHISGFQQINFILGNNNIGKTTILEAVYAWACGQNVIPFLNIPIARGRYSNIQTPYWLMEEILATVNDKKTIPMKMSFEGKYNGKSECFNHTIYPSELLSEYDSTYKDISNLVSTRNNGSLSNDSQPINSGIANIINMQQMTIAKWDINHNEENTISKNIVLPLSSVIGVKPFCQAKFIDVLSFSSVIEIPQIYASLKREKMLDEVTNEIKQIFPEINGFDYIPYPDGTQSPVSVIKNNSVLPLYSCGDGVQKWFYILGALTLFKNCIICIDEIDAGFHYTAQKEFSASLIKYAIKNNVQLFITTHNLEYLTSFLQACNNTEDRNNIRIITMRECNNEMKIRNISASEAYESRDKFNLELR